MSAKKLGSSQVIEFFISLFVGVLAIVGALLIVGFLYVDPVRHPPGQRAPVVAIEDLMETCEPSFQTRVLPHGCTLNKQLSVEQAYCSNRECDCDSEQDGSICCCRSLREEPFADLQCPDGIPRPRLTNATLCGCAVCDDFNIQVHVTVIDRDTEEPIPAALILQSEGDTDSFHLLGITNNHGHLMFYESLGKVNLSLKVIASGYVPHPMAPRRLHPHKSRVDYQIVMIPHMNVELGLGGSALTLRLGSMAAVSAPAGAFRTMDGNIYEDVVNFQGMFVTPTDFSGVPGLDFNVFNNKTRKTETLGVFFVARFDFMGAEGEQLTSDDLLLQVSMKNNDGALPDVCLITYNETANHWEKYSDFVFLPSAAASVQKRQSPPVILDNPRIPLSVFAAVAVANDANCWLQGRTFLDNGDPSPNPGEGPFISIEHTIIDNQGNPLLLRFGTNTGAQAGSGLQNNALCLPVDCGPYVSAIVEAREDEAPSSNSLAPVDFPVDTFNVTENAPISFGTLFSFEEHIPWTPSSPKPFYSTQQQCVARGQDPSASPSEFFSFIEAVITRPQPIEDSCFIKVQILDCFQNNSVTINSVNPDTGAIDDETTVTVSEPEETFEPPTDSSGDFIDVITTTDAPFTGVCDETTATLRAACIPFVCGDNLQVRVSPSIESNRQSFCVITGRSVLLSNSLVSDIDNNAQLILRSSNLVSDDFNSPDLGLYHVPGRNPTAVDMARELCFAGTGNNTTSTMNDITAGAAVEFSCF